ncbi:hypothetical protein H7097_01900 [Aeromicrobium sp.]|nr:hypothetical protein [Candidatus Saccharibacteria bacterium]
MEDTSNKNNEPKKLYDIMQEYLADDENTEGNAFRKKAAEQLAARNLLKGAAEQHLELLADKDADRDAVADSRRGVMSDGADLLAVEPDFKGFGNDTQEEPRP